MPTQKPLRDMIPELLSYINVEQQNRVIFADKLMQIYNGNLLKFVEDSCRQEYSAAALQKVIQRIPSINLLNKVVGKLSKVYDTEPERECGAENDIDEELLDFYEDAFELDTKMQTSNELLNLHKNFALEPYNKNGQPGLRILPANTFLVYSDDPVDPTCMTVFIKFMGTIKKVAPATDKYGKVLKNADMIVREVKQFYVYSDNEFMILDAEGDVSELRDNPVGIIPFVYCSASSFELIPTIDSDNYSISILIPKLLADLNYAVLYSSHSIVYGVDVEFPSDVSRNPDDILVLRSTVGANGEKLSPQLNVLKPSVDIAEVLNLITQTVSLWLDTKGIKSSSNGGATPQNAVSGIAKMIDEGDATSLIKKQMLMYSKFEGQLWSLIKKYHNYWISNNMLEGSLKDFSLDFKPHIKFGEVKVVPDRNKTLDELKKEFDMKLVTVQQALQRLNPSASKDMLEKLYEELLAQSNDKADSKANAVKKIIDSANLDNSSMDESSDQEG